MPWMCRRRLGCLDDCYPSSKNVVEVVVAWVAEQGVGLVRDDVLVHVVLVYDVPVQVDDVPVHVVQVDDVPVVQEGAYLAAMDTLAEDTKASSRGMAEAAWELELEPERFQCCEHGLQTHLSGLRQYNPAAPIDRRDFLQALLPQEIFLCLFE